MMNVCRYDLHTVEDEPDWPSMTAAGLTDPADICIDNNDWKDEWWRPCSWYQFYDPGCSIYHDQGQRLACPNACHTCEEREYVIPVAKKYLLHFRGICMHNKRHNLHLILGLNFAYIFTGVGIASIAYGPARLGRSAQRKESPW